MRVLLCAVVLLVACGPDMPIAAKPDAGPDAADVPFDVASAQAIDATHVAVTFDAAPDATQAAQPTAYAIPGLTVSGTPTVSGNTVTLETSAQDAISYTVTVSHVQRDSDHQALAADTATVTGAVACDVTGAASTSAGGSDVTCDAPPNGSEAVTLANYTIAGLDVTAATLAGSVVTLTTAGQTATTYALDVANVTRASDGAALTVSEVQLAGTPVLAPTVTDVVVTATNPDNGTTPFNTGTTTVTITGTDFETVACPNQVALDDLDGAGAAAGTHPTSCTVDTGHQITATFPAGIRTNAATGWNVIVTNDAGTNATSAVTLVPRAGLLVSEVFTGASGATDHEFVEVYNPTATPFDPSALKLHVRSGAGADTNKTLTQVTTAVIPPHGFLMMASSVSAAPDAWFAHADMTYSAALVGNGGAYISLSATKDAQVIDKVGWGTQPAPGFEGTALANIPSDQSAERLPAAGQGHATDTDNNLADFNAPSTAITPRGTADGPEPAATFDVIAATAPGSTSVVVTFDAPPDPVTGADPTSYAIPGLTVSAAAIAGETVTLTTSAQTATSFTVTVSNVTRAFDGLPLTNASATFTGRGEFDVTGAASTSAVKITVTFSDPPDPASATTAGNYAIDGGLLVTGTPVLAGSTVTLSTSAQTATTFTVTVTGVTRAGDGETLTVTSAQFTGTAVSGPTVTNVVVASTSPDNGTTPFNTGATTVTLTGTDFDTVVCPAGVKLDDTDGAGVAVGTVATSCSVDSSTQITATFPSGIRTNGATGWNVLVTNTSGTNPTSTVPFVPRAGLLISEIYTGSTGATDHEYIEVYNPTANPFDATTLKLHTRAGTGGDTNKTLTAVTTNAIPSHGFLLIVSSASAAPDVWFAHRDMTFSASLVGNGGAYISLSATHDAKVLDKVGWGTQPAPGFEGTVMANVPNDQSAERLPAGGAGNATDTDNNLADFLAPSTNLTPLGTVDPPQP